MPAVRLLKLLLYIHVIILKRYSIKGGCKMKSISTFVIAFIIIGFFFLALPVKGNAQQQTPLCCQNTANSCEDNDGEAIAIKCDSQGDAVFNAICNENTGRCIAEPRDVPTLSEWGLIAMAGVLGLIGFMVIRRRKATS